MSATFTHEEIEPTLGDRKTVYIIRDPYFNTTREVLLDERHTFDTFGGGTVEKYTSTWVKVRNGKIIPCKGILKPFKIENIISLAEEQPLKPLEN